MRLLVFDAEMMVEVKGSPRWGYGLFEVNNQFKGYNDILSLYSDYSDEVCFVFLGSFYSYQYLELKDYLNYNISPLEDNYLGPYYICNLNRCENTTFIGEPREIKSVFKSLECYKENNSEECYTFIKAFSEEYISAIKIPIYDILKCDYKNEYYYESNKTNVALFRLYN